MVERQKTRATPRRKPTTRRASPRDRDLPMMVYVNETEREHIKANAQKAGMSVSSYLRAVGQGQTPKPPLDLKLIEQLAEISTAQITLAHLLKDRGDAAALLRQVADFQTRLSVLAGRMEAP